MKTLFSPEVKQQISEYSHDRIGLRYMRKARALVEKYEREYESMRARHQYYGRGWHAPFTDEHRFMNRVVAQLFEDGILPTTARVLDIGAYDAMLPAVLRANGVDAWGWDRNDWGDMWGHLAVRNLVNVPHPPVDVAVMLNYCHNWRPEEIRAVIEDLCGNIPGVILMDREVRTPHANNKYWLDDALLSTCGIDVVKLPLCRQSVWSDRDLLILET